MPEGRLITSGCSCTAHCWPTWADYLGRHYDEYVNLGVSGGDNATIARNIIFSAKPNDTVVVTWTSFPRFSRFSDDEGPGPDTPGNEMVLYASATDTENSVGGWKHQGEVCFTNKDFFLNQYHRIERFRTTLDAIKLVELHSRYLGYSVWNFSMTDWFTGGIESVIDDRLIEMQKRADLQHFYLDNNLINIRDREGTLVIKHKYSPTGDSHPTPWINWLWLRDHIAPEMKITLDQSMENQVKLDQERVLRGDVD